MTNILPVKGSWLYDRGYDTSKRRTASGSSVPAGRGPAAARATVMARQMRIHGVGFCIAAPPLLLIKKTVYGLVRKE
jgi:hypothetical protein